MSRADAYSTGHKLPPIQSLPTLTKRTAVRVPLPPAVRVYAQVRQAGATGGGARGLVSDIGAAGAAIQITEGMRFDVPEQGQAVQIALDFDGGEALVRGVVVRARAAELSVAFPRATTDAEMNVDLLLVIARAVTRQVQHFDRRRWAAALTHRLPHERFHGAGFLDVRLQSGAWWQIVFLDYLISWSAGGAVETGTIDRSFAAQLSSDPARQAGHVGRHDAAWTSLKRVAALIASRCAAALPAHAADFTAIARACDLSPSQGTATPNR